MLNPAVLVPAGITLVGMVFLIFFLKNRLKATTAKSTIIKSMDSSKMKLINELTVFEPIHWYSCCIYPSKKKNIMFISFI